MSYPENKIITETTVMLGQGKEAGLPEHLYRQFKKAERDDFYTEDQFFNPLIEELKSKREAIANQFKLWKAKHENRLKQARDNQIDSWSWRNDHLTAQKNGYRGDYEQYKTEQNKSIAEAIEGDLSSTTINNYVNDRINLFYPYLTIQKIDIILGAIEQAKELVSSRAGGSKGKLHPESETIKNINPTLKQLAIYYYAAKLPLNDNKAADVCERYGYSRNSNKTLMSHYRTAKTGGNEYATPLPGDKKTANAKKTNLEAALLLCQNDKQHKMIQERITQFDREYFKHY